MEQQLSQNLFLQIPLPHSPWSAKESSLPIPISPLLPFAMRLNPELNQSINQSTVSSGMCCHRTLPRDRRKTQPTSLIISSRQPLFLWCRIAGDKTAGPMVSYNLLLLQQITLIIYSCVSTNRQASDSLDTYYFKITKKTCLHKVWEIVQQV